MLDIAFIINSILLGAGLAMDAFSVSVANGLHNPVMHNKEKFKIAGTFAFFQFFMPMAGWFFVHTIAERFVRFQRFIPWIAFVLLLLIGEKMIFDAIREHDASKDELEEKTKENDGVDQIGQADITDKNAAVGPGLLFMQGIATSIDALSVGFTIADYGHNMALLCSMIIAVVTFVICMVGIYLGIKVGMRYSKKAAILGGCILIFIGLEIFIKGVFL